MICWNQAFVDCLEESGSHVPTTLFGPLKMFQLRKIPYRVSQVLRGGGGSAEVWQMSQVLLFLFFEGFPNYLKIFLLSFILEKQMLHILTETLKQEALMQTFCIN